MNSQCPRCFSTSFKILDASCAFCVNAEIGEKRFFQSTVLIGRHKIESGKSLLVAQIPVKQRTE